MRVVSPNTDGFVGTGTDEDCPMSGDRPMSLRFPIVLALSIICLAAPACADGQAGVDAYKRGDYATALRQNVQNWGQGQVL